jgi:hypothetical protein
VCKTVTVKHTPSYIYLGSPFTEDCKMKSVLDLHLKTRTADLNKFKIFCRTNATMPYQYKKKVLQAVIIQSLFYGCDTWLTDQLKTMEQLYVSALKALLGVRETTRTDVVILETGMPTLKELIRKRTSTFVKKNIRGDIDETPLSRVYKMCESKGTPGYRYIKRLLDNEINETLEELKAKFENETGTKATKYKEINPDLKVHPVYNTDTYIDERKRVVFTRFRVSSHSLKIETGRWARINPEDRVCDCDRGGVQDERHIVFDCSKTTDVRGRYGINDEMYGSVSELMDNHDPSELVDFIDGCMKVF